MKNHGKTMAWGLKHKHGIIRSYATAWKGNAVNLSTVDEKVIRVYITEVIK